MLINTNEQYKSKDSFSDGICKSGVNHVQYYKFWYTLKLNSKAHEAAYYHYFMAIIICCIIKSHFENYASLTSPGIHQPIKITTIITVICARKLQKQPIHSERRLSLQRNPRRVVRDLPQYIPHRVAQGTRLGQKTGRKASRFFLLSLSSLQPPPHPSPSLPPSVTTPASLVPPLPPARADRRVDASI